MAIALQLKQKIQAARRNIGGFAAEAAKTVALLIIWLLPFATFPFIGPKLEKLGESVSETLALILFILGIGLYLAYFLLVIAHIETIYTWFRSQSFQFKIVLVVVAVVVTSILVSWAWSEAFKIA